MDSKNALAYGCFYLHKLYEEVERIQEGKAPHCGEEYWFDEKLTVFLNQIKEIGIDKVIEDLQKMTLDELKDLHYFNIN